MQLQSTSIQLILIADWIFKHICPLVFKYAGKPQSTEHCIAPLKSAPARDIFRYKCASALSPLAE